MAGSFKNRAKRGFNFMNDVVPDWKSSVDVQMLDMQSETACVLGQIYGTFDDGYKMICELYRQKYGSTENVESRDTEFWKWLTNHGFAIYREPTGDEDYSYVFPRSPALRKRYRALTEAWRELLVEDGTHPA